MAEKLHHPEQQASSGGGFYRRGPSPRLPSMTEASRRLVVIFFVANLIIALLPVLSSEFLPIQDWPQHLMVARVLNHYDDAGVDYCLHFEKETKVRPYMGYYGLATALSPLCSEETSFKIALCLYLLLTPISILVYTKAVAPDKWPAALVSLLALYNGAYYLGFIAFLQGIPFVFLALAALARFLQGSGNSFALLFALLTTLAYFSHALALAALMAAAMLMALLHRGKQGRQAIALCLLLILAGGLFIALSDLSVKTGGVGYRSFGSFENPAEGYEFVSPLISLVVLFGSITNHAWLLDGALWLILLVAVGVTLFLARKAKRAPGGAPGSSGRSRTPTDALALPVSALLLSFLAPNNNAELWAITVHFPPIFFLSLAPLVPRRCLRKSFLVLVALLGMASSLVALQLHLGFNREASSLKPILPAIERNKLTIPLILDAHSRWLLWVLPYMHIGHLANLSRGGYGTELIVGPQVPVKQRPGGLAGMRILQSRPLIIAAVLPFIPADFVLARGASSRLLVPPTYESILKSGGFELYRRSPPGEPPHPAPRSTTIDASR